MTGDQCPYCWLMHVSSSHKTWCPMRPVICGSCHLEMNHSQYLKHRPKCPKWRNLATVFKFV